MVFLILALLCDVFLYSYSVVFLQWLIITIICYIIIIITHHPIISPVLINILSFAGMLFVLFFLTANAIEKKNIIQ